MDGREWMYTGFADKTAEWFSKTEDFVNQAFAFAKATRAFCPCVNCANRKRQTKTTMSKHLIRLGFTPDYTRWTCHGETQRVRDDVVRQRIEEFDDDAGVADMLND